MNRFARLATILLASISLAADFQAADVKDLNPNVLPAADPRAKDLPRMVWNDLRRRMQDANQRESEAFARIQSKDQWQPYRDVRIQALRESLGAFPEAPKGMRIVVTKKLEGDGYRIHNLVYETRPGFWGTANLYLPAKAGAKMPGLVIVHSHHSPCTQGELQDMGMTWARSGSAVLVPELLGHGERRQHGFRTASDYPKRFTLSRQDYYFRYNSNLELSVLGDSLMGWFAWDLMRSIDVLLKQPGIDEKRIILLGAVAGGGDPAGVTAALDPRVACLVPFNFGGWQPESNSPADADRTFAWFGEGYWESTRGLRGGAAGGFAHFIIDGSIAPRKLIYAHEFKWNPAIDPAWPRLQKIYGFYGANPSLGFAHGAGSVRGNSGPENTHCNNIGPVHRKMIYPYLKRWFGMPIPEEFRNRRKTEELLCWTEEARKELMPRQLHEILHGIARKRIAGTGNQLASLKLGERTEQLRKGWKRLLGDIEPRKIGVPVARLEAIPGASIQRIELAVEPGLPIFVPILLIAPQGKTRGAGKRPVVVMVAQAGKAAFLKERSEQIATFLQAGIAVALVDVRGTGETRPKGGPPSRGSTRTSISQTDLILGQPILGEQLRDLRAAIGFLKQAPELDGQRIGVWGDSFAKVNRAELDPKTPLEQDLPLFAEPGGALLAELAGLFEGDVKAVFANGGLRAFTDTLKSPYFYVPHEAIIPGAAKIGGLVELEKALGERLKPGVQVNGLNQKVGGKPASPAEAAKWMAKRLLGK